MTKRVLRDAGVPTADFAVIESVAGIAEVTLPFPLFLKPLAEGSGKGVGARSRVTDTTLCWRKWRAICSPVSVNRYWWRNSCPAANSRWASPARGRGCRRAGRYRSRAGTEKFIGHGYGYENKSDWEGKSDILPGPPMKRRGGGRRCGAGGLKSLLRCRDGVSRRYPSRWARGASRASSRSIPWPESAPAIPTSVSLIADFAHLSYRELDRKIPGVFPCPLSPSDMKILVL